MRDAANNIVWYLRSHQHNQDVRIQEIKESVDKLDNTLSVMKQTNQKYFYVLAGLITLIFGILAFHG